MKENNDLVIGGINVFFPHNPYPCQINFMEKVVESIKTVIFHHKYKESFTSFYNRNQMRCLKAQLELEKPYVF